MATNKPTKYVAVFADEAGNLLGTTPKVVCSTEVSRATARRRMLDNGIVPDEAVEYKLLPVKAAKFGRVGWRAVNEEWDKTRFRAIPAV